MFKANYWSDSFKLVTVQVK